MRNLGGIQANYNDPITIEMRWVETVIKRFADNRTVSSFTFYESMIYFSVWQKIQLLLILLVLMFS